MFRSKGSSSSSTVYLPLTMKQSDQQRFDGKFTVDKDSDDRLSAEHVELISRSHQSATVDGWLLIPAVAESGVGDVRCVKQTVEGEVTKGVGVEMILDLVH